MQSDTSEREDARADKDGEEGDAHPVSGTPESPMETPPAARVTRSLEPESFQRPLVDRSAWLRDDDYWRTVTYRSATGHLPAVQGPSRPLPRPQRFSATAPFRSGLILLLVIGLVVMIPVGVVVAANVATTHLTLPAIIPGIIPSTSTPIATPTSHPTVIPTLTPKKK